MKVLITGATGLIGKALSQALLVEGHEIVVLTRNPGQVTAIARTKTFAWQPEHERPPVEAFDGVTAVIHLAGENVAARWTPEHKRRIRASRVLGTRNLVLGMQQSVKPPAVFISSSAVGLYGNRGDEQLVEQSAPGNGFLADVCREWEAEIGQAQVLGVRTVALRTGVVLSRAGGALKTMLPAFQFGVAGKLGNGRQWFPWIHIADIVGLIHHALLHEGVRDKLEKDFQVNIPRAAEAGIPNVITFSGNRKGMSDGEGVENTVLMLNRVKALAEKHNVTICLELLNSKVDHKDYMADHTAWGAEVVRRVNSPRVKLLYDIYHMQIMEGDIIRTIRQNIQHIAHFHTGGNPGRNEIDETQELNWRVIALAIAELNFTGYVAHEFVPKREPLKSLREAIQIFEV